jgi:hypothetical protein
MTRTRGRGKGERMKGPIKDYPLLRYVAENDIRRKPGCRCSECGRTVWVRAQAINTDMALLMIALVRAYEEDPRFYQTPELISGGGKKSNDLFTYGYAWGILDKVDTENLAGAPAQAYAPTELGIKFVYGLCQLPHRALFLDAEFIRFEDDTDTRDIHASLGNKFSYNDLMGKGLLT